MADKANPVASKETVVAARSAAPALARSKSRRHSESEKAEKLAQIERRLREGSTLKAAAEEAGISDQTYYQWKRPASPSKAKAPTKAKAVTRPAQGDSLAELEAENLRLRGLLADKLRSENAALRKKLALD